jgi:proteic killer suppression protein
VIKSFRHKGLRRFFEEADASRLSVQKPGRIGAILQALDDADEPGDMNFPGWRFHPLTGDRKGFYSVTVSGNWRITFRFQGKNAIDVDLEDDH